MMSLDTLYLVGRLIGDASYILLRTRRSFLEREFALIFPEKSVSDIRRTARETFRKRSITELENMSHERLTPRNIDGIVVTEGIDHLDRALLKGRGVILLIAHFGAYLQVLAALGLKGYLVNQLANVIPVEDSKGITGPEGNGVLNRLLFRARLKSSGNVLPVKIIPSSNFMRPVFQCLKSGEILVMAVDGKSGANQAHFRFLYHEKYWFSTGPVSLAQKTGAAIVPAFVVRGNDYRNRLVIGEEIPLDCEKTREDEIKAITGKFVGMLERYVRKHPDHYGMELLFEQRRLATLAWAGDRGGEPPSTSLPTTN
jgi:KDO2-lipid IV(A) lauroyltransferase